MNIPSKIMDEGSLILLVGLIQFVNILDFMMVMPLGPDFARALDIPASQIGVIGGAYTLSAAITGLISALYLDQFARNKAIIFCLVGLAAATISGAFVWDKESMIIIRVVAGMFGGPLTALSIALIADFIPPERRGRAMGKVSGSFAAASVIGVPFGLELATRISWHAPFIATGIMAFAIAIYAQMRLPHCESNRDSSLGQRVHNLLQMLRRPLPLISYGVMGLSMMAGFMIIPNIAAHVQMNLEYPRAQLGVLYFCGGVVSFFGMRAAGLLVDKTSSSFTMLIFTSSLSVTIYAGFIFFPNLLPVVGIFIVFMVSMTGRMVAARTLSSKIPAPHERGAFMSVESSVSHIASTLGAFYASQILVESQGKLLHMPIVGWTAIGLSIVALLLTWRGETLLKKAM